VTYVKLFHFRLPYRCETLNTLFIKHPDSKETAEGKLVYSEIEDAVKNQEELYTKWEAAVGGIREEWAWLN